MASTPPPLKKRSGNKGWLTAGLVLLVLIVITALYVPFVMRPGTRDLPEPPDDSDLRSQAVPIPDEENAFHFYVLAANATRLSEANIDRLYERDEMDEAYGTVLSALLQKNEEAIDYYRQALEAPRAQAPILKSYDDDSGLESAPTENLLHLLYLDIRHRFVEGNELEALRDALELARLGQMLMHAHGITYIYLEASYLQSFGLETFIELVGLTHLSGDQLRPLGERFDALYDDGSGLAAALTEEYPLLARELEQLTVAEFPDDEEMPEIMRKLAEMAAKQSANTYQINRMMTDLVESLRPLIADSALPLSAMRLDALNEAENIGIAETLAAIRPAGLSRLMVLLMLPFLRDPIEAKCSTNTLVSIAKAKLALRIYHIENGELPQSLDELVPDYLDAVPLDDMDGQPTRYDHGRARLYSAGIDPSDTEFERDFESAQLTWALLFAAKEDAELAKEP